jgi:hypothetical protein
MKPLVGGPGMPTPPASLKTHNGLLEFAVLLAEAKASPPANYARNCLVLCPYTIQSYSHALSPSSLQESQPAILYMFIQFPGAKVELLAVPMGFVETVLG